MGSVFQPRTQHHGKGRSQNAVEAPDARLARPKIEDPVCEMTQFSGGLDGVRPEAIGDHPSPVYSEIFNWAGPFFTQKSWTVIKREAWVPRLTRAPRLFLNSNKCRPRDGQIYLCARCFV
jgi:hypothetical protein